MYGPLCRATEVCLALSLNRAATEPGSASVRSPGVLGSFALASAADLESGKATTPTVIARPCS
jgi:hypothetical protein